MLGIFLDTEASGLDAKKHKILEVAFKIVDLSAGEVQDNYESIVSTSQEEFTNSDKASLHVNGLTWEVIRQGTPPNLVSDRILEIFKKHNIVRGEAVFICQNPSFDRIFFTQLVDIDSQESMKWPYHWLDLASMYWSFAMKNAEEKNSPMPWDTGFTKDKIAKHFNIGSEDTPHRAMNGVEHLLKCYEAVVGFPEKSS
ncbi:DNA polymerase III subunit epsilon [Candidatus Aerophobetes bacterium]|uniref:DNA polymerase III subunit epsilon n=1 Tax=Aerophobetes bacterium TaxID=2030807 RepID=A0A2A4YMG2_UNCAE|nr:MAG: DNA polymerase III subunit epsilon [Candidatus Aerophobetes bacterium]